MSATAERALRKLVREYQDHNSSTVAELEAVPTPLAFSRFVAANRPVVIRGAGKETQVPALERWTDDNADAIVDGVFVEPANVQLRLSELLGKLREEQDEPTTTAPVYYVQTQNGNLDAEYLALLDDVGRDGPSFAREVFDPYENIYMVVRGTKTFTLLPPTEAYCLHERVFPHATYSFDPSTASFTVSRTTPPLSLPWIPVNPLSPNLAFHPRYALARPLRVTLHEGDMLYLPALWFHFVEQDVGFGPAGRGTRAAIAVNWWYDMRHDGLLWATYGMIRRLTLAVDGREEDDGEE
ncbi:hypothetical protein Rhopal_002778-T1 [Rhodotorula paludigena]|uniref:JmjC domain-containing protein n=1 Tax=Rhodotorula paludigena TaxID=86838 RepID=A0AAV5GIP2_9BASI|nr:hypothetical protein Rhopal_002778-T1 [Rhodotorula paludigena]